MSQVSSQKHQKRVSIVYKEYFLINTRKECPQEKWVFSSSKLSGSKLVIISLLLSLRFWQGPSGNSLSLLLVTFAMAGKSKVTSSYVWHFSQDGWNSRETRGTSLLMASPRSQTGLPHSMAVSEQLDLLHSSWLPPKSKSRACLVFLGPDWHHVNSATFYYSSKRKVPSLSQDIKMFIAALFAIVKYWKQPKCLISNVQMNKIRYIHIVNRRNLINGSICIHKTRSKNNVE